MLKYVYTCARAQVDVSGSSFLNNYAGGAGGALSLSAPAAGAIDLAVAVRDCAFAGNSAGSELFLLGSSLYSGYGGRCVEYAGCAGCGVGGVGVWGARCAGCGGTSPPQRR